MTLFWKERWGRSHFSGSKKTFNELTSGALIFLLENFYFSTILCRPSSAASQQLSRLLCNSAVADKERGNLLNIVFHPRDGEESKFLSQ